MVLCASQMEASAAGSLVPLSGVVAAEVMVEAVALLVENIMELLHLVVIPCS